MSDLGGGGAGFQQNPMPMRAPDDGHRKSGSAQQGSWVTPEPKTEGSQRARVLAIAGALILAFIVLALIALR